MPRLCSVCTHPDRGALESAIDFGQGLRDAARTFDVSHQALLRHLRHHGLTDQPAGVSDHVADHQPGMHATPAESVLSTVVEHATMEGRTPADPAVTCSLCGAEIDTSSRPWRNLDGGGIHFDGCHGKPASLA